MCVYSRGGQEVDWDLPVDLGWDHELHSAKPQGSLMAQSFLALMQLSGHASASSVLSAFLGFDGSS